MVQEVLRKTQAFFKEKGFSSARLDAELILSHSLGWNRIELYQKFDCPLSESELDSCRANVKRRLSGEPVAYILGERGFYKHDFIVSPEVLIPRPETELLVEKALERAKSFSQEELNIADLGCGSGCIGLSLLAELKNAKLTAVDLSSGALSIAKKNYERINNLELSLPEVEWIESDVRTWGEKESKVFSLIVANPPYIAKDDTQVEPMVKKFEPSMALFAEKEGLAEIFNWTQIALTRLAPQGVFFCEIGSGQKSAVETFLKQNFPQACCAFYKDYAGLDRFFEVKNG